MRERLFRAKLKHNGEWVYWNLFGQIVCDDGKTFNYVSHEGIPYWNIADLIPLIIPETFGEWTGLTDKNGTKIFEGDIVIFEQNDKKYKLPVEFKLGQFFVGINMPIAYVRWNCEIVGSIYDNPELLEGGKGE